MPVVTGTYSGGSPREAVVGVMAGRSELFVGEAAVVGRGLGGLEEPGCWGTLLETRHVGTLAG